MQPARLSVRAHDAVLHIQRLGRHFAAGGEYAFAIFRVQRLLPRADHLPHRRQRRAVNARARRAYIDQLALAEIGHPEPFWNVRCELAELLFTFVQRPFCRPQLVTLAPKAVHEKHDDGREPRVNHQARNEIFEGRAAERLLADEILYRRVTDYSGQHRGARSAVPRREHDRQKHARVRKNVAEPGVERDAYGKSGCEQRERYRVTARRRGGEHRLIEHQVTSRKATPGVTGAVPRAGFLAGGDLFVARAGVHGC